MFDFSLLSLALLCGKLVAAAVLIGLTTAAIFWTGSFLYQMVVQTAEELGRQ